jgi:hypothetical protein
MPQYGGTIDSYDAVNRNREDLIDAIYDISPTATPFLSMLADTDVARATTHEWQSDTLAAASTNAAIEGDAAGDGTFTASVRLTNVCQISKKVISVSGTEEAVSKAGPSSELAYQREKAIKELKRDMELVLTNNQAVGTGSSVAARTLRSLEAWYSTNTSRGVGGANGSTTTAATDASAASVRAFTEDLLKDVLLSQFNNSGEPATHVMCAGFQKQRMSAFTGNATRMNDAENRALLASVDVYESDFGRLQVIPNRFVRARTVHVLTKGLVKVAYLRAFVQVPLAKTGDSEQRLMLSEYTLQMSNEAAHGVIADLTTS